MRRVVRGRRQSAGARAREGRAAVTSRARSGARSAAVSSTTELPSGTVTFLFTDIEGSTAHWEERSEAMDAALTRHNSLMLQAITANDGYIFKNTGDGFCTSFHAAPNALRAALDIQRAVRAEAWEGVGELRVRVALLTGEAKLHGNDYRGQVANRADRLMKTTAGGQILIGGSTAELVRDQLPAGVSLRDLGEQTFRDVRHPIHVYEVAAEGMLAEPRPQLVDTASLRVYMLGRFRVELGDRRLADEGWGRKAPGRFFKCLLTRDQRRMMSDQAFELFWPDSAPEAAAKNLGSTLTRIRDALVTIGVGRKPDLFVRQHGTVEIRRDVNIWIDGDAFEEILARARQAHDPYPLLEEADRLYAGHYLPDDIYEEWAGPRREALRRLWRDLQLELARHREARNDVAGASTAFQRRLDEDACDELAARELMSLCARNDQRADALRVYERVVQALSEELNARPSAELVQLHQQLVAGEITSSRTWPTPSSGVGLDYSAAPPRDLRGEIAGSLAFVPAYPFPNPDDLIGRRRELAVLERALAHGRTEGQVVLIGAPAGTGKSALVGALVRHAQDEGVLCLAGGSYEQQGIVPLGPIRDAFADYLLTQPPERLRSDLGVAASDLAQVIPDLRYHLDVPESSASAGDSNRLFASLYHCLSVLSAHQPVLLCLEDLHASDAGTVAVLQQLARRARPLHLTLVCTYRTEEVSPDHPLAPALTRMTREGAQRLALDPLDRDETTQLVTALLEGPASERLDDSLYEATEGNPLFVEHLVLALREERQVDRRGGIWYHADRSPRGLPTVIRDVLGRRFERLSARCGETLAMAAVLGRTVDHAELVAALDWPSTDDLIDDLCEAAAAQILDTTPTGYAFTHALLREAIYWSLSAPRRMLLHGRVAEALERLAGDRAFDRAAELAHHYALATPTPERLEKALHYGLVAGRQALAVFSYREALAHFQRACALVEDAGIAVDDETWLTAIEGQGYAESFLVQWSASVASLRRFVDLATDPARRGRARGRICVGLRRLGDVRGALAESESGLADLPLDLTDPAAMIARLELQHERAFLHYLEGRFEAVLALGEDAARTAQAFNQPTMRYVAANVAGMGYLGMGLVEKGLSSYRLALEAAENSGDKKAIAGSYLNLGIQSYRGRRFGEARQHLERAVALFEELDGTLANALQTLARVSLAEGDPQAASELVSRALVLATEAQDRWIGDCDDVIGMIHAFRCDWTAAESSFERGLDVHRADAYAATTAESLIGLGAVREHRGEWDAAFEAYNEAYRVTSAMDPCPQTVAAQRQLGRLLLRRGDEDAIRHLESAFTLAQTIPDSIEYPATLLAIAELRWWQVRAEALLLAEESISVGGTLEQRVVAHAFAAGLSAAHEGAKAREHAARAVGLVSQEAPPRLRGLAELAAARAAASSGDLESAEGHLTDALRHFVMAETPYDRGIALVDLARTIGLRPGSEERADRLWSNGLRTLCGLGMRLDSSSRRSGLVGSPPAGRLPLGISQ